MKKVLFTIQWYGIPAKLAASANALCDEKIINHLKDKTDIEIHVLSYGLSGFPLEEEIDGVWVHRFRRSRLWDAFIHTRNEDSSCYTRVIYWTNRILMRIKQVLFFFSFPNYEPWHVYRFKKAAKALHQKHKFDLVISEFNGVDSLLAGMEVKKSDSKVRFLPICWDSISGGRLVKWMPKNWCLRFRRKMESEVIGLSDKAIVMEASRHFHEVTTSKLPHYNKFRFLDVPYLDIEQPETNRIIRNSIDLNKPLTLLYSGTMGDRDPTYVMDLLDNIGHQVELTFITAVQYHSRILSLQKGHPNVKIRCFPYMSHSELTEYQEKSDILVNFRVSNANAISGKIFDYMRLGKPILSTTNHDNEACIPYLTRYPQSLIIDERLGIKPNSEKFMDFLVSVNKSFVNLTEVESSFRSNTPKAYIEELSTFLVDE